MKKNVIGIVGVVSVVILGAAIFFRPGPSLPESGDPPLDPEQELDLFLNDNMNYGIPFSVILANKRIRRAGEIAKHHPEHRARAAEVTDSLRARLARKAVIEEHGR